MAACLREAVASEPKPGQNSGAGAGQAHPGWQSKQSDRDREINVFFNSDYTYCDAEILANYWEQSITEAKARIGRKILWGDGGLPFLEQFLLDARIKALQSPSLCYYRLSRYSYYDAVALADFWGEPTPWDAKLRIEKNLILGNDEIVGEALELARNRSK